MSLTLEDTFHKMITSQEQLITGGVCMKGTVNYDRRMKRYYVSWYHEGKTHKIWFYQGDPLTDYPIAERLLNSMRSEADYCKKRGEPFRIEKYIKRASDVVVYLNRWIEDIKETISPATYKDYSNSIRNHLTPFYEKHSDILLHDIQYDNIIRLMNSIKRSGKGKHNVVMCLHACLAYAHQSRRIAVMPSFPKRKQYNIVEPVIQWLPSDRQEAVIRTIPEEHQPIFWWLKYHLRRPSEACALLKDDFDGDCFTVRRGFSAKRPVERTKTGEIHVVPCHVDFYRYIEIEKSKQSNGRILSPYFFINPTGKKPGKHYTLVFLEKMWLKACQITGENISLYKGLKHSTASQFINERGMSLSDLQIAGDWSRLESVKKYGKVEVSKRRELLESKVIRHYFGSKVKNESN